MRRPRQLAKPRLTWQSSRPFVAIGAAAFVVIVPFFFYGDPSGHDFEFHLNSWMEVVCQWKLGILYPRWAALAHYAYGEARFLFYPPTSWMLGAWLGVLLPWKLVPGLFVWIALTLSGSSMFVLARRYLDYGDALIAAILYAANPYFLVVVYWRSAYAELLAGALFPLLLLYLLKAEDEGARAVFPMSLLVAAAWLTNVPAAVMFHYSLALLVLLIAIRQRSLRIVGIGAAAIILGGLLAAFFLLPAVYEQPWVNIAELLSLGVRPIDNFLFHVMADVDHNRFNLLVSLVAAAEMAAVAGAALLWWRKKGVPRLASLLVVWAGVAALLMFPFTSLLWDYLPKLRFVQLPWRWLLCLNVAAALLIPIAFRRVQSRVLVCITLLAVVFAVWHRVQPPWWDSALDLAVMQDDINTGKGYEGTDEYVPAGADPYEINRDARRVMWEGEGHTLIHILQWDPEAKSFIGDVDHPGKLALRLFNYPAWHVEVNGQAVPAESREVTGQLMIPVQPGKNAVMLTFVRTSDRTVGALLSALTLAVMLALKYRPYPDFK